MSKKPKAKRIGDLQRVDNTQRRFGSAKAYYFTRLQQEDGKEKRYLFTSQQLVDAEIRALKNPEDLLQAGIIRDLLD